jgi:hypothetical protein
VAAAAEPVGYGPNGAGFGLADESILSGTV